MRFQSDVTVALGGRPSYGFQPWYAALLYQLNGDERYARFAIDETDRFVTAEEQLVAKGLPAQVAGDSYLDVGSTIGNLALVYDWCHDRLTPEQRERWRRYGNQAVWNVWNHTRARWGNVTHPWTGWSVDNPSNNYYYSFLRATMLLGLATLGETPEAESWLQLFRTAKIANQLVPTFNRDLVGGGSREGTGYGTAMKNLFQLYDWWERSTGDKIAGLTPHAEDSIAYLLHSIVPTQDRVAPVGDHSRDASAALFDYHREYLLALQSLYPAHPLGPAARSMLGQSTVPRMRHSFNFYVDYLYDPNDRPPPAARAEMSTTYWARGVGHLMTRSSWDRSATYAHFICGPYTESHAHRDQGSFLLFKGTWLAADGNLYSRSGLEQGEEHHNLVRFESAGNTLRQRAGNACHLAALADTDAYTYAAAQVTPLYRSHSAVRQSEREFVYLKPDVLVVFDRAVVASAATRRIWTLNLPGAPTVDGDVLRYEEAGGRLEVRRLAPTGLTTSVLAWPSLSRSMSRGVRVDVAHEQGAASQFLHVLSLNGALRSSTRHDVDGQIGVQLQLSDGRTASVRFRVDGVGAHLDLTDPARPQRRAAGPLPTGVQVLPLTAP
ncbi:MAG: hypothetical protein ACKVQR_16090 [Aquabacterium sp.]